VFTWGVNNQHGQLGLGPKKTHVYEPEEVLLPLQQVGLSRDEEGSRWKVGELECGESTLWVSLVDGTEAGRI